MRDPVVAGTFYPADRQALGELVDGMLDLSTGRVDERPWGIVVPHAGYRYSGPVAATAYGALRPWASEIASVLLLGPAHFVPLEGCATTAAGAWRTPLGDVTVDEELRRAVVEAGGLVDEGPHDPEHSLEVQLPFLQRSIGERLRILPVAVGQGGEPVAAALLARVPADLVVISTDLSHYLDIAAARTADRRTAGAIVRREPEAIGLHDACGAYALRGAVSFARSAGREIAQLDLRTSGDTAGDPDRVVGYGAFAIGAGTAGDC